MLKSPNFLDKHCQYIVYSSVLMFSRGGTLCAATVEEPEGLAVVVVVADGWAVAITLREGCTVAWGKQRLCFLCRNNISSAVSGFKLNLWVTVIPAMLNACSDGTSVCWNR